MNNNGSQFLVKTNIDKKHVFASFLQLKANFYDDDITQLVSPRHIQGMNWFMIRFGYTENHVPSVHVCA